MGLFKSYSEKEVKRVQPIVNKINALEPEMQMIFYQKHLQLLEKLQEEF